MGVNMEQNLYNIFKNILNIKENELHDEMSMKTITNWDSQKHIELIISIEEEFAIPQMSMDEIVEMTSVGAIKRILRSKGVDL